MSDFAKNVKFSLKVVINKYKTKVLFAEIDSDLADVLISFLTLPLGRIVRILKKHYGDKAPVFGSITTLYDGLSNLDTSHFWTEACKQMLLDPVSSFIAECRKLKLDIGDNQPIKYYTCENSNSCAHSRSTKLFAMYYNSFRCDCGRKLIEETPLLIPSKAVDDGVFTTRTATFIISDDLQILPNETASVKKIVSDLGLMGIDGTEFRNVTFGFNEIMDLLRQSLFSSNPLTNLVLKNQIIYGLGNSFIGKTETSYAVKYLKVILQKSTNKFLFAEAEDDFVEVLFNFLVISLGGVESVLSINTSLKNIDNLYRSLAYAIDDKYLRSNVKNRLINPAIPQGYLSKNWLFSNIEEVAPKLRYKNFILQSPKGNQVNCIKGPRKYMVKDDLTVTPLCMTLYLNTLNELNISLSDVDEVVLKIGLEEASNILKASLSSTSALSVGLNHLLKKQPKQEQCV